jgi:hypothetical protein
MSANVQQSGMAATVGASTPADADALTPSPALAPAPVEIPAAIPAPVTATRRPRLTAAGYLLLILGSAMVFIIPHLHLRITVIENGLVILSIIAMLAGAGLVVWSFVRPMLRK